MEFVGARLGPRDDRDRADLVQLRLVVGRQHLILADRELRERVAGRAVLSGQATAQHIILLADAIDEDVDRVRPLRPALDARAAVRAFDKAHAGREIGEGQEVAAVLRQLLDQARRDVDADLPAGQRADAAAGDDDVALLGLGGRRRGLTGGVVAGRGLGRCRGGGQVEVESGILPDAQGELIGIARALLKADLQPIGASPQRREIIAAVRAGHDRAAEAGVDFDQGHVLQRVVGRGADHAAQRRLPGLRHGGRAPDHRGPQPRQHRRPGERQPESVPCHKPIPCPFLLLSHAPSDAGR